MTAPLVSSITCWLVLSLAGYGQASKADSDQAIFNEDFVERYTSPKDHIAFKRLVRQARAVYNIQGEYPYFEHVRSDDSEPTYGHNDAEVAEYLNSTLSASHEKLIEINLEGDSEHHLTPVHVRNKRQADGDGTSPRFCLIPKTIIDNTTELMQSLNQSMMLGMVPFDQSKKLLMFQVNGCPRDRTWFPKGEQRYRSTCPWNLINVDLGMDAFPRYVLGSLCLCPNCMPFKTMGCVNIKFPLPYLVLVGCTSKTALMKRKMKIIDVGCTCSSPKPNKYMNPFIPELPPVWLRPPNYF